MFKLTHSKEYLLYLWWEHHTSKFRPLQVDLWESNPFGNFAAAAAAAKLFQSCLTLCDPIDGSPPGFSVPPHLNSPLNIGVPQDSILEFCSSVSALSLGNQLYLPFVFNCCLHANDSDLYFLPDPYP